jgi:hypothetical protein
MTAAGEHAIGVFERKILKAIFGPRKEEDRSFYEKLTS